MADVEANAETTYTAVTPPSSRRHGRSSATPTTVANANSAVR